MNILIQCHEYSISHRSFSHKSHYAVISSELLESFNLDKIDGHTNDDSNAGIRDQISMLLDRLGIVPFTFSQKDRYWLAQKKNKEIRFEYIPFTSGQDLKEYLDPVLPFTVDKVITIMSIA